MRDHWYYPPLLDGEQEHDLWRKTIVSWGFSLGLLLVLILGFFNLYHGLYFLALLEIIFAVCLVPPIISIWVYGKNLNFCSAFGLTSLIVFPNLVMLYSGGFWESGGRGLWSFMAPLGSVIIFPGWNTLVFLLLFLLGLVFSLGYGGGAVYEGEVLQGLFYFHLIGTFIVSFIVFYFFLRVVEQQRKALESHKIMEQAHRLKNEFLNVMSHEIRTPLNAITGLVDVLLLEDPKEEQKDQLNTMRFASSNLLLLVNDILDYSKLQEGNLVLESRSFDVKQLLEQNKESFLLPAKENNVRLHFYWKSKDNTWVIGDEIRLQQVLQNLISNAIKFAPGGDVWVEGSWEEGNLFLSCSDNGIGISPEKQVTVFESFAQGDASITRKFGGTGLGLAIVKRIVELAGGTISLVSEPGKGSTFEVQIPWAQGVPDMEKQKAERILPPWDILVVDDNRLNLKVAAKLLGNLGANPFIVDSGEEALAWLKKFTADVILMDLQMPEMDGFETTERILTIIDPRSIIVPLTAEVLDDVRDRTREMGMQSFIPKPINRERLWSTLIELKERVEKKRSA